jgi:hypothetical protein
MGIDRWWEVYGSQAVVGTQSPSSGLLLVLTGLPLTLSPVCISVGIEKGGISGSGLHWPACR